MAPPSGKRQWKAPFTITSMEVKDVRFPTSQGKHGSDAMVSFMQDGLIWWIIAVKNYIEGGNIGNWSFPWPLDNIHEITVLKIEFNTKYGTLSLGSY